MVKERTIEIDVAREYGNDVCPLFEDGKWKRREMPKVYGEMELLHSLRAALSLLERRKKDVVVLRDMLRRMEEADAEDEEG